MDWIVFIIAFFCGLALGRYLTRLKLISKDLAHVAVAEERKRIIDERELELSTLRQTITALERNGASLEAEKKALEVQKKQYEENSEKMGKALLLEFEGLAHKILDEKSKKFDENSKKELLNVLNPFKENIKNFQESINKTRENDLQERTSLKKEIQFISEAGKGLKASSDSLAKALRGDSKAQGKWGELILEKVLEGSGLRKGAEFSIQDSYRDEQGNLQRPDITIHLSNQKQLFIDSKVCLAHYDQYINSETDLERETALERLESNFCERIKELGNKNYQSIKGIKTVDFVILFTPIESALSLISQNYESKRQKSLFEFGWEKNVIIASPLTLMPILKTINTCWVAEYQSKNAIAIAEEANKLYDKFTAFIEKFDKIQNSLRKVDEAFIDAKSALNTGKGNIIKRLDDIRHRLKKERKIPDEYFGCEDVAEALKDSTGIYFAPIGNSLTKEVDPSAIPSL